MKLAAVLALLLLVAPARAEQRMFLEPELGAALLAFDHDCPGAVENGSCSKGGARTGGVVGLGARFGNETAGATVRGRFALATVGLQYFVGIGGYIEPVPSSYLELALGFGESALPNDISIATKGYMASLRVARELGGHFWLAANAATFVYRTEVDSRYPMRSYEASVSIVYAVPLD